MNTVIDNTLKFKVNKLFDLMAKRNLNVAELARQSNIPRQTLYQIVDGVTTDPRVITVYKLAKFFDVSVEDLLISIDEDSINAKKKALIPIITWEEIKSFISTEVILNKRYESVALKLNGDPNKYFVLKSPRFLDKIYKRDTLLIVKQSETLKERSFIIAEIQKNIYYAQVVFQKELILLDILDIDNYSIAYSPEIKILGRIVGTILS